jgi:type III secretion protein T
MDLSQLSRLQASEALISQGITLQALLSLVVMCSMRIYAAMLILPPTADSVIKGPIRNALALSFGLYVALGQPPHMLQDISAVQLLTLALKETAIGLLLGLACGSIFWIAEGVGMLIDNQAGFNNVQQSNPMSDQQSTPVGNILLQLATVSFYALGGMMVFGGLMMDSFQWWPLKHVMPDWQQLLERFLLEEIRSYSEALIKLAGPVLMMLVIIDLGLGLMTKAAEKLEPSSLSQPIKGATALLMLSLLIAVFFQQLKPQLSLQPLAQRINAMLTPAASPGTR